MVTALQQSAPDGCSCVRLVRSSDYRLASSKALYMITISGAENMTKAPASRSDLAEANRCYDDPDGAAGASQRRLYTGRLDTPPKIGQVILPEAGHSMLRWAQQAPRPQQAIR